VRDLLWLIPLLPLAGFAVNGLLYLASHRGGAARGHGASDHPAIPHKGLHTATALISTGLSCLLSFGAILDWLAAEGLAHAHVTTLAVWIPAGVNPLRLGGAANYLVEWAFRLDPLSALMISFVTFVGFLIHVYSVGYMGHEEGYGRYFAYLNLFMFSMLILVLAANFVVMFAGWEGVGLCSYLLIGYWYQKQFAADAGKKAFVVNRIGDLGFILGVFGILSLFGTTDFGKVFGFAASDPQRYAPFATFLCLCLFVGAIGKSAQIPLYVWLPDAMAGPTPVSALIHAATMVTAGVYMVVRCNVLFRLSPDAMLFVAYIGCATAVVAASIALVQNDIKKVLAYSTVSQLGYMFLGCGVGAFVGGIFHVFTHAFFKACLFLGSGSVIHALGGEQDMRAMGGLRIRMPATYKTFLISTLAIAGIFPFAGFFSKDEILGETFGSGRILLYAVGLLTAGMTAFYMFRGVFMTFFGSFRGTPEQEHHVHESPKTMTVPLWILAAGAVLAGFVGIPAVFGELVLLENAHRLKAWLSPIFPQLPGVALEHPMGKGMELALMALSLTVAVVGIAVAYRFYGAGAPFEIPKRLAERFSGAYRVLCNKYYVDEFYEWTIVRGVAKGGGQFLWDFDARVVDGFGVNGLFAWVPLMLSRLASLFDQYVVDGLVNGVADTLQGGYRAVRRLQTGRVQNYAFIMGGGLLVLVAAYLIWR
jgi:NADH-quinone oxidoreductase subunit L